MAEGKGMWRKMRDAAEASVERASNTYHGLTLQPDGTMLYRRETQPTAGAVARVETAGEISNRVTVSRMLLTGPFAFALKKKRDARELYLTVEGVDATWVLEIDPKEGGKAREFAARVCTAGRRNAAPASDTTEAPTTPHAAGDVAEQLTKLAALRDQGILTDEEFATQKARLLMG